MATIMTHCTHGVDDPERATLPFVVANVAASADQEATVLLTSDAVWLATRGYARDVHKEGFPRLDELIEGFVAEGGRIWACGACTEPRGITADQLIDGATIVTAANVVETLASGTPTLGF